MTSPYWRIVEVAAQLLEPEEREAVLGDLAETKESPARALGDVLGLAVRRQLLLWKNWRPWLAAFGLALPASFLLMGLSLTVSQSFLQCVNPAIFHATGFTLPPGFWLMICNLVLLGGWSWASGFLVGSLSRRTLWVSGAFSFLPCVFCLSRFGVQSLSRFCLLLFLLPAVWGVFRGLRIAQIKLSSAILLAAGVTALTIPTWNSTGAWIPNWALSWPAWYLVATARRPAWLVKKESHG